MTEKQFNEISAWQKETFAQAKPLLGVRSFRIGDLVRFNTISDDSDYASNCFGVEPQNDWFDVQVYVEQAFGEIVKKNTIEIIYRDGRRSGKFYKIVNGIIKSEVDKLLIKKNQYNIKLSDIFGGGDLNTVKDFKNIELLKFIPLEKKYKYQNCFLNPPKKNDVVYILIESNIGLTYDGQSFYDDGKWIDNKTKEINTRIDAKSKWETSLGQIYIDGKIFVEDNGL
jgi:hypothetical protein